MCLKDFKVTYDNIALLGYDVVLMSAKWKVTMYDIHSFVGRILFGEFKTHTIFVWNIFPYLENWKRYSRKSIV